MQLAHPAWPKVGRVTAAIIGGYLFTYSVCAALARLLPVKETEAVIISALLGFVVYLGFILWAFAARLQRSVWLSVLLSAPLLMIGFWPQLLERLA